MRISSDVEDQYIHEVRLKYDDLLDRFPNMMHVGEGYPITVDHGNKAGIVIMVSELVDQRTLHPEDRIPDCLEGVPVYFDVVPTLTTSPA